MTTYIQLFVPVLMWSIVGILVKVASRMVDSGVVSFSRFLFAVIFLGLYTRLSGRKIRALWRHPWIWAGVAGKSFNYILENIAIARGHSYGNIVIFPIQAVFMAFVSVAVLKEGLGARRIAAVVLCVAGVLILSWNGAPVSSLLQTNAVTMLLFVFSSIGAGVHMLSQKALIQDMDSGDMNFSIFLWSALLTAVPLPFSSNIVGPWSAQAFMALVALGFITGISFLMYANALKTVPVVAAALVGNSSVLFTLLWSRLLFHDPMTIFTGIGTAIFIAGLLTIDMPRGRSAIVAESA